MTAVFETDLPGLIHRGKVRDSYDMGDGTMLMIATDRISAFDVVLPTPIPDKGTVLAQMSAFWFELTNEVIPNHFISLASDSRDTGKSFEFDSSSALPDNLMSRAMLVHRAERIDIECVVRAFITGSAWSEYRQHGTVNGETMPTGMLEAQEFPDLLFTPTTKAEVGHDLPMSHTEVKDMVGADMAQQLEDASMALFRTAYEHAFAKGIIIADTKFEFGLIDGTLTVIDEVLTPDSSRFWSASEHHPGKSPPSFDKQFVRDWLTVNGWNKEPPAPELPPDIVEKTRARYIEAFELLTGTEFTD